MNLKPSEINIGEELAAAAQEQFPTANTNRNLLTTENDEPYFAPPSGYKK